MDTQPSPIRVADFSTHVSGPTASLFLRSVGAEVVKVENPRHGDGNRVVPAVPEVGGQSIYHHALNWGAKSVTADPRSTEWPSWVEALAGWADVVIVGGRPSDATSLGLDRATIARHNPRAVHCHISGYGPTGPWAERGAHGQNPDALAGLVDLGRNERGDPEPLGWRPAGTTFAGVVAAVGILGALVRRAETGTVLAVETSLWEAALWWNWRDLTAVANDAPEWGLIRDFGSRYATYRTADDRAILVAPIEEKFWRSFCDLAGLSDLADRGDWAARYDFGEQSPEGPERARIATAVAERPLAEWLAALAPTSIPYCEILGTADLFAVPQLAEVEMLVPLEDDGGRVVRPPLRLQGDDGDVIPLDPRLPGLGAHTDEVRALLGLDQPQ